ncbi:MAG: phasin family protein [Rhodovibrionaceae bacterium]|nr:phasin family protein [Rhodovibrionaceae bacterium]
MAAKTQQPSRPRSGNGAPELSADPIGEASKAFADAAAAWQREVTDFMSRRWQRNLECCEAMLSCQEPQDAVDLQYRYAQNTAEDYLSETQRLIEIATKVGEQSLSVIQSSTRNALEQMNREE